MSLRKFVSAGVSLNRTGGYQMRLHTTSCYYISLALRHQLNNFLCDGQKSQTHACLTDDILPSVNQNVSNECRLKVKCLHFPAMCLCGMGGAPSGIRGITL